MKIISVLLSFTFITSIAFAQNSIPNGNFETWITDTFENPLGYPNCSNSEAFFRYQLPFNLISTNDAYNGNSAVQLTTIASATDTSTAYFVNSAYTDGPSWHGGFPYNQIPTGIRGYYKYNAAPGDSGLIIASFSNGGNNIGMYFFKVGGIHTSYTLFDFTFNPPLSLTPDSVIFAATSSNFISNFAIPGSVLILDSVSFTGVTSQPVLMNGDFELWENQIVTKPDTWTTSNDMGEGVFRTTNAYAGNYAIEMVTTLGEQNGNPRARPGEISTGYYSSSCSCMLGGYPFSNQIDTLAFYYKYVPADPNDTAEIMFNFKNSSLPIGGGNIQLSAASNWQYIEYPVNLVSVPDTFVIDIRSSLWSDSALSFIGAVLTIDEIHFKSQPFGTNIFEKIINENTVSIYPNPFKNFAVFEINSSINIKETELKIFDYYGRIIKTIQPDKHKITLSTEYLSSGIYFYELRNNTEVINSGKLIIE